MKIKEIDTNTLDFEGYIDLYRCYRRESDRVEQGSEEDYDIKYFKIDKSYEDMGF